jgi:hypothetical protein
MKTNHRDGTTKKYDGWRNKRRPTYKGWLKHMAARAMRRATSRLMNTPELMPTKGYQVEDIWFHF